MATRVLAGRDSGRRSATPRTDWLFRGGTFCAAVVVFVAVGYELGRHAGDAIAFVGLVAAASLFLLAGRWPWLPFAAGLFLLALIPVYWVPFTFHVLPLPGVVVLLLVAGTSVLACLARRETMSLSGLDVLVALLMVSMALSAAAHDRKFIDFFDNVLQWGVPYLAARITVGRTISADTFARIFAISGLVLVPFAAFETLTGENLFARFSDNAGESAVWGLPVYRDGLVRAQASFGQPIALSMFLGSAAAFGIALAIGASSRAVRERWALAAAALTLGTVATISRTGEIVVLVSLLGCALMLITSSVGQSVRRRAFILGVGALGVLLIALVVSHSTRTLVLSIVGSDSTEATGTANYRLSLLSVVGLRYFSWLGQKSSPFAAAGIGSVDNTFLWMLSVWGVLATALLFTTLLPMVRHLFQRHDPPSMRTVVVAVAVANIVGLAFVIPITQEQDVLFALLGAASSVLASTPRVRAATLRRRRLETRFTRQPEGAGVGVSVMAGTDG
jgi:hypothetical protein